MKNIIYYKFRSFDKDGYNLDNLLNDRISASTIAQLNDPFEGLIDHSKLSIEISILKSFGTNNYALNEQENSLKNFLEKRKITGIYSMSSEWQNELLWAHYADSHKGFCIEYNVEYLTKFYYNISHLIEVKYVDSPVNISILEMFKKKLSIDEILQIMNGIKSLPWSYEKEFRIVFDKSGLKDIDKRGLKSVTLGVNISDDDKAKILDVLSKKTVKVYQAKLAEDRYIIERELLCEYKEVLDEKKNFQDIDPFYLSEDYLEKNYPKKYLIEKALDIVRAEPYVTKINMCGFNPDKESEIFVWADVAKDVRPHVKFSFDEEFLNTLQ